MLDTRIRSRNNDIEMSEIVDDANPALHHPSVHQPSLQKQLVFVLSPAQLNSNQLINLSTRNIIKLYECHLFTQKFMLLWKSQEREPFMPHIEG